VQLIARLQRKVESWIAGLPEQANVHRQPRTGAARSTVLRSDRSIREALDAGREAVLGPAADGGYYLIALRREALHRRLFEGIAWSSPSVFGATLTRLGELGLDTALLPEAHDLDTVADLARFRQRLERRAELRSLCPRTAEVLL